MHSNLGSMYISKQENHILIIKYLTYIYKKIVKIVYCNG